MKFFNKHLFIKFLIISISFIAFKGQANDLSTIINSRYSYEYTENYQLRNERRVGGGIGFLGLYGNLGGNIEINFDASNSGQIIFGNAKGFNIFSGMWKHSFEGQYVNPYFSVGYSRWYSSVESNLSGNSYILDQHLSDEELRIGKFGLGFLTGSLGLQYNQLDTDWIGSSVYFEFNFLFNPGSKVLSPAASLGSVYYF